MPDNDSDDVYEPYQNREREKPDGLTRQQINQVLMSVEDMHPLQDRAKSYHIVPQCKWCLSKIKKPNFKHALRQTLMADMNLHMSKSEDELIENPFLILGFGINAYFDMMMQLCELFLVITVFFIPIYWWFSNNNENTLFTAELNPIKQMRRLSLGNMGGASTVCAQKKVMSGSINIECPSGLFMDYDNIIFGVMPSNIRVSYFCQEKAIFHSGDSAPKCTRYMDHKWVYDQLKECDKLRSIDPDLQQGCKIRFQKPKDPKGLYRNDPGLDPVPDECWDEGSKFYIQTPCIVRERQIPTPAIGEAREFPNVYKRQIFGLMVGCISVFVYLYVVIYIDYIKQIQYNKNIDFDVKTITAGDYTVEFDINKKVYTKWKETYFKADNPMSEMGQFKIYIQHKMEQRISKMRDLGYDGEWQGPGPISEKKIKIAQITFAFHNQDIINLLRKRGNFIKTEKWEKVDKINDKLDDCLKKPKLLDELQHPCGVFLTFESEEGVNRALHFNEQVNDGTLPHFFAKLFGQKFHIEPASEPTDIIWENRQFTKCTRTWKSLVSYFIILCLLAVSATSIYFCSSISTALKTKYPKTTCISEAKEYNIPYKNINATWLGENPGPSDRHQLEQEAVREYITQTAIETRNYNGDFSQRPFYTSALKCYCIFEKADDPKSVDNTYTNPDDPSGDKIELCKAYFADARNSKIIGISISIIIVIFNTILKKSTIFLLTWVGEDTYSQRLASITTGVFVAQFFNTGILLLLVNANLREHLPSYIAVLFNGKYYDYDQMWYSEVGLKIVQTMFINACIIPWTGFIGAAVVPAIKKRLDGKGDPYKTKKTSMSMLKALYSGGDYVIHFKYSGLLNIAYITLMYGVGMPVLFPLAVINYWNQYVAERIIVAYYMKAPAALDDSLTVNCINKLKFAPMLFLLNGAWMLGNQQIFANKWSYISDSSQSMISQHAIGFSVNWATPVLGFGILSVVLYVLHVVFGHKLAEWGFQLADHDIKVDEDLPHFFDAVKLSQADELVDENKNMHHNFGFEPNDPDTIKILDSTKLPKKAIQGTPWYQILSNKNYASEFNYIGANIKEREKLIEDGFPEEYVDGKKRKGMTMACKHERWAQSDMIVILLNIAYIPDEVAKKINFKPGWQVQFKENMKEFKKNWAKEHGKPWEYQNLRNEKDYIDHICVLEKNDPDELYDVVEKKFGDYFVNLKNIGKSKKDSEKKPSHAIN